VLDQVTQPSIDSIDVKVEVGLREAARYLGCALVGKRAGRNRSEDPHDGDVLGGLVVDRVPQRLEPCPVNGPRLVEVRHGTTVAEDPDERRRNRVASMLPRPACYGSSPGGGVRGAVGAATTGRLRRRIR